MADATVEQKMDAVGKPIPGKFIRTAEVKEEFSAVQIQMQLNQIAQQQQKLAEKELQLKSVLAECEKIDPSISDIK